MRILSQKAPPPRLLTSVAPEVRPQLPEGAGSGSQYNNASVASGNRRAVLLGLTLAAAVMCTVGLFYKRQHLVQQRAKKERKLVSVSTHSISPPAPIVTKLSADQIHVTAISLGHPKLAIINGQQVGEGEQVTIHTPSANIAVTLRILKISDGRIDLSDGTQVISARLEIPPPSRRAKP